MLVSEQLLSSDFVDLRKIDKSFGMVPTHMLLDEYRSLLEFIKYEDLYLEEHTLIEDNDGNVIDVKITLVPMSKFDLENNKKKEIVFDEENDLPF